MEIGQQIKKYREKEAYSQEGLAEALYVSRQTISNWENERSYPDIHNLLMMCELFNVSLDDLVKGDVTIMNNAELKKEMDFWAWMMVIPLVLGAILLGPLMVYFHMWGYSLVMILLLVGVYSSTRVDKIKYKHKLENYDRIVAFMNGKDPSEVKTSKRRDLVTSILSFIFFVGGIVAIAILSVYLSYTFLA
ncbi:XRE family transcriptional regulator [Staphylococcus devriesei]|uniref:XRE family transcriptional regulator n=1 Tax=Staphylococcus devriesei TaxID=586733 RepID=A0A2T4L3Z3_9STAP|nr:helix-turn-helix transcriptional regulator [Staphylococcus devriesei]MCE5090749.1 helix-turn-helix transcriptional regulator [Staphylococcus devriesei]PTE74492.1 XRE family transcriptional regulator [Staphylococcus devriesei]PTF04172.1 XRE family transcriptional regulator [Staphylococcus devriesei]PTF16485.1 XRE family transcriptional regulator [Staphylococcus devriesei]RIL74207.1 XRE family transcriptional regulator [Staphylococcus devriesei]